MDADELKLRTKRFALRIIKLVESLPKTKTGEVIGRQLLRCGTSVGANYRSACRARSKADFISKSGIAIEEADETIYWMELLIEGNLSSEQMSEQLLNEANELTAILTASVITARKNLQKSQPK